MDGLGPSVAADHSAANGRFFEAVLGALGEAVLVVRPQDRVIVLTNSAVGRLFRLDPAVLVGASTRALYASDEAHHEFAERSEAALDEGRPYEGEHLFRRADGMLFQALATVTAIDPRDWTQGVVSVLREVTDLRRAEADAARLLDDLRERVKELRGLHRSAAILAELEVPLEEAFQRVVDVLPGAWQHSNVAVARIEYGNIVAASDRFRETEWARQAEFTGLDGTTGVLTVCYLEALPEADDGPFLLEERELMRSLAFQLEAHCRNREQRAALERDRDRFLTLFRTGPVAMALSRPEDGVFVEVNERWVEATGYEHSELIGRSAVDLDLWELPDLRESVRRRLEEAGVIHGIRLTYRRRNGEPRQAFGSIQVVDVDGRRLWFTTLHDVTEQARYEEERSRLDEQKAALERLGAIGELAGGVAHDFNNLLLPILINTELALTDAVGELRARFEEIRDAALQGRELTKKLLAFGRRQVLQRRTVDLNEVVHSVQPFLRRVIPESIEIELRLDETATRVRADPTHLEQVVMNLVVNARDAIGGSGRISIATYTRSAEQREDRLDASVPSGAYTYLEVSDDGPGIPADVVTRMFEPFFTTKVETAGTGLGLATVHGIVQQHEGHILLDTKPGLGTTFRIGLPCAEVGHEVREDPVALPPAQEVSPDAGRGTTILVVEDDDAVRRVTVRALSVYGFDVLKAAHPKEALELLASELDRIDLVLSDMVMPGMTGLDLRDAIHDVAPRLPMLFVSGYSSTVLAEHGIERETLRMLEKPFSPDSLVRAVLETIEADGRS